MITSKDYILTQIKNLVSFFPFIKIRYEHNSLEKEHFLEVLPALYYNANKGYIDAEIEITKNFEQSYPGEIICFLTEGSLYSITNITYEAKGLLYGVDYNSIQPCVRAVYASGYTMLDELVVKMREKKPVLEPNRLFLSYADNSDNSDRLGSTVRTIYLDRAKSSEVIYCDIHWTKSNIDYYKMAWDLANSKCNAIAV